MNITALFQKFMRAQYIARSRDTERHVYRDWFLELFAAALLLVGVSVWSFYFYSGLERGDFFSEEAPNDQGSVALNREKLDTTLSFINQKAIQHEALKTVIPTIADPSI